MEPRGLTGLPVEVLHHISSYLSVQDVLSCSLTCHYLRNALNGNYVWKQYLPPGVSCLETQEQHVTPALHIDESLSPLCENRQHFVRKTHLINNWKKGHCVEFSQNNGRFPKRYLREGLIFDDKYLFVTCFTDDVEIINCIEVWEISKIPIRFTVFPITRTYHIFFIVDSYLIVVDCCTVFVYHINLPEKDFPFLFCFLLTEENVTFNESEAHSRRCVHAFLGWQHLMANNYLISFKSWNETKLYIRDIHNASKLGSFELPLRCINMKVHSYSGKNLFFILRKKTHMRIYTLILFDIAKMQFNDTMFSYNFSAQVLLFDKYVILFKNVLDPKIAIYYDIFQRDAVISVFDFNSSLKLKKRRFDNASKNVMLGSETIVNGRFAILCNDGFHVIDALTLETVDRFKCDNTVTIIKEMVLFESFVVIATSDSSNALELWDLKRKNKLSINFREYYVKTPTLLLYLDTRCTKLVMSSSAFVKVIHFW